MHTTLSSRLAALEKPIRVGIVGIGSTGKGLVYQSHITRGIQCAAMADIHVERAIECAKWLGRDYRVVDRADAMSDAIGRGLLAVCEDGNLIAQCAAVDVMIESSNAIAAAGKFSVTALEQSKHLVLMNAETDLTFGPYLMQLAIQNGVVYTSCDGDQHVVIKHLVDEIQFWGFELVMAGNIKGFLNRYSNPTKIIPEADKRMLDYRMATSYTDGTKLNIEMALIANALGLSTAIPGMRGPRAQHVRDALSLFDLPNLWKDRRGVVDYVLGAEPRGGVFAIGYCENEYQRKMLAWFPHPMGKGPFYIFYRPYHLSHVEGMSSVAAAALDGRPDLQPTCGFKTNVYAHAKRDLRAGEKLDGVGGYLCYGMIENCADNEKQSGLPICLAEGMALKRNITRDEQILMSDVLYDSNRFDLKLYSQAVEASNKISA